MSRRLALDGCRTQPLVSYLKALGVLRLVAAQADPGVTALWEQDRFVLHTELSGDDLIAFFVNRYRPSPIVSPWNGGSGFHSKDNQDGIAPIEVSVDPRLAGYREAIGIGRSLVTDAEHERLDKAELLARCRARLPDDAVAWMDAAVVLLADGPAYPPLLGTGGNDGRLDFSNNFMQRVLLLLGVGKLPKGASPERWFRSALFGTPVAGVKAAIGQFDPGRAGGPNSAALGAAESSVNPADFVLLVEGSLQIAAGAARRLGSSTKKAAMPFTFASSPVGYPSAAEEEGRGELWLPLWRSPTAAPEIGRLFAEARCAWRGGQARSGLDAARAAVTLGVDRGIDRFTRFALVTRNGLATAAVPVGTIDVAERDDVRVLADIDGWLDRVRRAKNKPHAVASGLRTVEAAMFKAATRDGAVLILDVLAAAARLDSVIATATAFHEGVLPLDLPGRRWMRVIEKASTSGPEVRLAACFASLLDVASGPHSSLRMLLRPVRPDGGRLGWTSAASVPGFGQRPVVEVLASAHTRRFVVIDQLPGPDGDAADASAAPFRRGLWASPSDVQALLHQELDVERFSSLLSGLLLLDWAGCSANLHPLRLADGDPLAPLFCAFAPFFGAPPIFSAGAAGPNEPAESASRVPRAGQGSPLTPQPTWAALLGRETPDSLATSTSAALKRLRIARWHPAVTAEGLLAGTTQAQRVGRSPARSLSAALLLHLNPQDRRRMLERVAVRPSEPT